MTTPLDTLGNLPASPRRVVLDRIIARLQADPVLQSMGVPMVVNPRGPQSLDVGPLVLIVKDQPDRASATDGGRTVREHTFALAALARFGSATGQQLADQHADKLYHHAAAVIKAGQGTYTQPTATGQPRLKALVSDTSVQFDVDGLQVDGALVAGTWALRLQQ